MAVVRINQLPQSSGVTPDDLVMIMDDPSGNKITKNIPVQGLLGGSTVVVTAHGSSGNPTDHTNIQNAINSLTNGGRVFLQAGDYYLSNTITIDKSNIEIVGAGRSTLLNCIGNYGDVFHCALPSVPTSFPGLAGLLFSGFRMETSVPRNSGAAIYAEYTHNAIFRDLYICDTTYGLRSYEPEEVNAPSPNRFHDGIKLIAQDQAEINKVVASCSNVTVYMTGSSFASADFSYDGIVQNCDFYGAGVGTGIYIGEGLGGSVIDYVSLNDFDIGVKADWSGSQGGGIVTIRGGYAEGCTTYGYETLNYQNTIIHGLWGNLHVNGGVCQILGAMQNHTVTIDDGTTAVIIGATAGNIDTSSSLGSITTYG